MITPNKFIPFQQSVLAKLYVVMEHRPGPISVKDLFDRVHNRFESLDQFILTLDVLFLLGRIDINFKSGIVTYAD